MRYLDGDLLDALCDVLELEPGDLLERESKGKRARTRGCSDYCPPQLAHILGKNRATRRRVRPCLQ